MPPEWLPTVGLSETYLVMSPLRNINQCHVASEVVMRALHLFGLPAEAVALEIEVENSEAASFTTEGPNPSSPTVRSSDM